MAIILGHQEYVTQKEYDNLKAYVYNGGILLLMDSNILYSEVKYSDKTKTVTLFFRASTDNGQTFGDKINLSNTPNSESTRVEIS